MWRKHDESRKELRFAAAFELMLCSIPGVLLGSTLCPRVPLRALRGGVAIAILYAEVRLL
jgi:uncharacterized membrane protein YfcA